MDLCYHPIVQPRGVNQCVTRPKILTNTETKTFYSRQFFLYQYRDFFRDQIFRYRYQDFFRYQIFKYRDFFNEPKFFDTETFFGDQIFQYRYQNSQKNCHRSRDRDRDFCIWSITFRDVYRQILANFGHFLFVIFFPETKFSDTDTETFSETKFSDTETFLTRPNLSIPIPRLFFRDQFFRSRYRDFFSDTKFSDTNTETTE